MDDFHRLSALELISFYKRRDISPVEVTRAVLERIGNLNPNLNAFVTITSDLAIEQARVAEQAYAKEATPPPLAGVPGSLKDLTSTKGVRTAKGSLLHKDWIPDYDAPLAERLYDAGMVMLGKTNTPELGWKGDSDNRVFGPTHNPWLHGKTAGGSSGGAAAAVASCLGPISQGTDGAGSIRIPASFCGTYGIKPSWGLVPQYPASAVELLSHVGPITRTVGDAALMLTVMAGAHPLDRISLPVEIDYLGELQGSVKGLRIAWSPDLGYASVDSEVLAIVSKAANRFSEMGCLLEENHPPMPDPWEILDTIWASAFAGVYLDSLDQVRGDLDPGLLAVAEKGSKYTAAQLARANALRIDYYHGWRTFMESYDLVLTPTLPVTAFQAGDDHPGQVNDRETTYLSWTSFTYPFNITGQPAATVPCGFTQDGLPVGLQIVGKWRDDVSVLRASAAFEEAAPWADHHPLVT